MNNQAFGGLLVFTGFVWLGVSVLRLWGPDAGGVVLAILLILLGAAFAGRRDA